MSSSNGRHNLDPARCPMTSCDELERCGGRCACPPCECPACEARRAKALERSQPDPPSTLF